MNANNATTARALNTVRTLFNSASTAAGDALALNAASLLVQVVRTANTSASTVQIQGSLDGVYWSQIGADVTTAVGTAVTQPWNYLRVNVTVITNTAKTASGVTQTDGVATFSSAAHGFLAGEYVTIAGANEAGYNGSVLILTKDANSFTYAVDAATASPATGVVTANGNLRVFLGE